jgi:hypothetical protein
MKPLFLGAILAVSLAAQAQEEMPAVGGGEPIAAPAAQAMSKVSEPQVGTNIIGDRESPIGLYITPWRNAEAEKDIDRPARLLQEQMLPIDRDVFGRQLEYHEALSGALKSKGLVTPQERK